MADAKTDTGRPRKASKPKKRGRKSKADKAREAAARAAEAQVETEARMAAKAEEAAVNKAMADAVAAGDGAAAFTKSSDAVEAQGGIMDGYGREYSYSHADFARGKDAANALGIAEASGPPPWHRFSPDMLFHPGQAVLYDPAAHARFADACDAEGWPMMGQPPLKVAGAQASHDFSVLGTVRSCTLHSVQLPRPKARVGEAAFGEQWTKVPFARVTVGPPWAQQGNAIVAARGGSVVARGEREETAVAVSAEEVRRSRARVSKAWPCDAGGGSQAAAAGTGTAAANGDDAEHPFGRALGLGVTFCIWLRLPAPRFLIPEDEVISRGLITVRKTLTEAMGGRDGENGAAVAPAAAGAGVGGGGGDGSSSSTTAPTGASSNTNHLRPGAFVRIRRECVARLCGAAAAYGEGAPPCARVRCGGGDAGPARLRAFFRGKVVDVSKRALGEITVEIPRSNIASRARAAARGEAIGEKSPLVCRGLRLWELELEAFFEPGTAATPARCAESSAVRAELTRLWPLRRALPYETALVFETNAGVGSGGSGAEAAAAAAAAAAGEGDGGKQPSVSDSSSSADGAPPSKRARSSPLPPNAVVVEPAIAAAGGLQPFSRPNYFGGPALQRVETLDKDATKACPLGSGAFR